jgi:DnaJ-class molecular chaperone
MEVNIKPRAKPESKIIIKNSGLPFMENKSIKGDLILVIKLKFPNSNKEYNKAIRDLSNLEN